MISALKTFYQHRAARKVFGRWAETYEADVQTSAYSAANAVRQALLPFLEEESRITDLGVGTGLIWEGVEISDMTEIAGLDISPDMMEQASAIPELGPLYCCNVGADEWPLEDASQDLIVAAGLFEYLTQPMAAHVFEEARRALKPGGRFILTYIPGTENGSKTWEGKSGNILSCYFDPLWIERQEGFGVTDHTAPFIGSTFANGSSYDYRLIVLRKSA